jgi:hypothetical protein
VPKLFYSKSFEAVATAPNLLPSPFFIEWIER